MNKQQSKVRYSIRKVSIGILSISIGMFLALGMSNKAYADEIDKSKDFTRGYEQNVFAKSELIITMNLLKKLKLQTWKLKILIRRKRIKLLIITLVTTVLEKLQKHKSIL